MPKTKTQTEPEGRMTFRVWRESEQRWYTSGQLRRQEMFNKFKRVLGLKKGKT